MINEFTLILKKYIQPFERVLAYRELSALTGVTFNEAALLNERANTHSVVSIASQDILVDRLTYWESVQEGAVATVTKQSLRESTVNLVRNGIALDELRAKLPFDKNIPLPNRRCLRYGTHGIHEYRGKFFPNWFGP